MMLITEIIEAAVQDNPKNVSQIRNKFRLTTDKCNTKDIEGVSYKRLKSISMMTGFTIKELISEDYTHYMKTKAISIAKTVVHLPSVRDLETSPRSGDYFEVTKELVNEVSSAFDFKLDITGARAIYAYVYYPDKYTAKLYLHYGLKRLVDNRIDAKIGLTKDQISNYIQGSSMAGKTLAFVTNMAECLTLDIDDLGIGEDTIEGRAEYVKEFIEALKQVKVTSAPEELQIIDVGYAEYCAKYNELKTSDKVVYDRALGIVIKECLDTAGKSASNLARVLGVTRATVSQYVTGGFMPSIEQVKVIQQLLGVEGNLLLKKRFEAIEKTYNSYGLRPGTSVFAEYYAIKTLREIGD